MGLLLLINVLENTYVNLTIYNAVGKPWRVGRGELSKDPKWIYITMQKILTALLLFSCPLHASFIESTIGAAVVNDATAVFFNPAALTVVKNTQLIGLGSYAVFHTRFTGQATQSLSGFSQTGSASTTSNYYLPSLYLAQPLTDKINFGLAIISNSFDRSIEDHSILRYDQSGNKVQSVDLVPALGFKFNDFFSLGFNFNLSHADILLKPVTGIPALNIPDSQSSNDAKDTSFGADLGFLLKPGKKTTLGFNYRSAVTYHLKGHSILTGATRLLSDHYQFKFWTPARSVLSVNQIINSKFGLIATAQYIQWSIFKEIAIKGLATQIGNQTLIVDARAPYGLHNSWLFTAGANYRLNPKWIIRAAGTFNQSPGNPTIQITTGNSIIAGGSMGYELTKSMIIDASYAHAFMANQSININTARHLIQGMNKGSRDSVSVKLTLNLV